MDKLIIIGGGLAGCEAAWQAAQRGIHVLLFEMRPVKMTEAHKTPLLAELVCSNSFRSREINTGPGLLKKELALAGSLVMSAAKACEVQAGSALAVDRTLFAGYITDAMTNHGNITIVREEVTRIPDSFAIIATGPLTSGAMADTLKELIGGDHLFFYDAIAPIVDAGSIDFSKVYLASRYGKGGDDYVNCPMSEDEYYGFFEALQIADKVHKKDFEDTKVFEGCMPVEVMAERGRDTLRFGPLKPVGLPDPKTGRIPYAVIQLRAENIERSAYNMVGFQTRLKWQSQKEVFTMVPGLEHADFLRLGSMHRNTFINSPLHLNADLSLKEKGSLYFAGQITGVEGYIESTAMGLIAGINASGKLLGKETTQPPRVSAHGSLIAHITGCGPHPQKSATLGDPRPAGFQPSNINFGLVPAVIHKPEIKDKKLRRQM